MTWPINCRRLCLWLSSGEAEGAFLPARALARLHLSFCPHCRRYRAQMELIADAARLRRPRLADPESLEPFIERLVRLLNSKGAGPGA